MEALNNISKQKDEIEDCFEYTMCKWEADAGADFIALELILDWEGRGSSQNEKFSPLFDPNVKFMAISNMPH